MRVAPELSGHLPERAGATVVVRRFVGATEYDMKTPLLSWDDQLRPYAGRPFTMSMVSNTIGVFAT
jgi:hypothetical protein